jgi:two-component system, cell cycle response regulator CpdR
MAQKNSPSHAALVLIVDHDEATLDITAEVFEILGYDVVTAESGRVALEVLKTNPRVSVLFTDIQMPDIGGKELAEIALKLRPGIRVVFTSGVEPPPEEAVFVPKPYKALDLIRVLPPLPLPS